MRRMEHVGNALQSFLRGASLEKPVRRWQTVLAWPQIVGDEIAAHSEAIELKGGTLWIAVPSSSWRQHILYLKPQILQALARNFAQVPVRDIRCVTSKRRANWPDRSN